MELKIKKQTIEFEGEKIRVILIDFGISFYVWIGKHPNIEFLCATFPVLDNKSASDNFASSSILGEDEICASISSYLCK
ncbi:uncharacterized protein cubi_03546 [Cryptosporidium ubiquitum]|uniref:Uncharacterized protein n=1 Tax=Cryptosporidium ubiquitum TaxID=857276 RepID=A0A1J4ML36_9CRYT|nr:uncharacterized protein cubi_03546 [Cryptosporidium ubiquitum]OII73748.1 hypothetical protein cubi_03546 [Cryptosporidium ubiquitum]